MKLFKWILIVVLVCLCLGCAYTDTNGHTRYFPDSVNGTEVTIINPNPFPIMVRAGNGPQNGSVDVGNDDGFIIIQPSTGYSARGTDRKIVWRGFGISGQFALKAYAYNPQRDQVYGTPAIQWFYLSDNYWNYTTWEPYLPTPPDMVPAQATQSH